ncbi:5-methyltetrahydrofolate--homocysteine methyltransferase [Clostridium tetanomorphum]|uniref:Methionine synthase n=1 Tax=Clostridium tetanomorphum TaxID=1553 RepID=A0A923EED8_CLOTT|nr:homocysteine S-methyltransferase family protein [Clostridium tetanomorphum]KAJ51054.1 5-methyltetrahydrofolate:homocysteine S-methyltransferase [Clostridium tetanomorphum DSM 665]MBC2399363.1 dihydropteroate synthase [Clostridium tetanomorphum]MBP1865846.1 5-methyltetrahydrofolate--homocysteine methyltransferase [Clostridium tetanomorphum]NRS85295.1 5-methyltetrahydrofolate--homocysteine methyltransferase [Clostridium tetanomorphum]NRZ98474.1 5-methyltetrahydrofolate--homocysteine methyltra
MNFKELLKKKTLIFDGAMGTMLQKMGLKVGELPEILNLLDRDKIINIHKKYIKAGANIITTNTFGANELKLKNSGYIPEEIIASAVNNAKKASEGKEVLIALDIGPIGQLLEPIGTLTFEEAYEIFKKQIICGVKHGADLILIETMTDLYEAKAAVLAAKENSNLPVICTMTFQQDRRTFTGCTPLSMIMTLEGLGVDALGVNCSLGPVELEPIVDDILNYSSVPVIVQPNAGLPQVINKTTVYKITPLEFAKVAKNMVEKGVSIIGGCCGTDDEFIRELCKSVRDIKSKEINKKYICGVCTPTKGIIVDGVKVVGERINPTGKKLFKEALRNNDMEFIFKEAIVQIEAGADVLDVNVGLPEINEEEMLPRVIKDIQSIIDTPLQIDSSNAKAIEKALRIYNGKPIVNSVNGEDKVLDTVLPMVKKYGALVVGLTLDNTGIPYKAEDRYNIAEKIVNRALKYGIGKENIIIDCLTLTASAQQENVMETLKALSMVKEKLNVKTTLGVSNVSFGLPNRELLNRTFLAMALEAGLDLPIINPLDVNIMDTIQAFNVLSNKDYDSKEYIKTYGIVKEEKVKLNIQGEIDLKEAIIKGLKEESIELTKKLLKEKSEMEIINEYLIPALDIVGERYEKGIIFLPALIQSAETVKKSFHVIKEKLVLEDKNKIFKGKILLATVKGDIHDIGKNIVKTLLENYGYDIIDLGKDVSKEIIVDQILKNNIKLIGLSALMTTTVKSMEETIQLIREKNIDCKVMVGGAVLNEEYANMINADFYAKDAKEAVEIAKKVFLK